jgi:hypothetical protein
MQSLRLLIWNPVKSRSVSGGRISALPGFKGTSFAGGLALGLLLTLHLV